MMTVTRERFQQIMLKCSDSGGPGLPLAGGGGDVVRSRGTMRNILWKHFSVSPT
jgi:hypothetical protein